MLIKSPKDKRVMINGASGPLVKHTKKGNKK
jgi:hypothetical protein